MACPINSRIASRPLSHSRQGGTGGPLDDGDFRIYETQAILRYLDVLDRLLGNAPLLAGEALSLADLLLAPQLHLISAAPEVRGMLEGTRLLDWLERMLVHPGMLATSPIELKLPGSLRSLEAA